MLAPALDLRPALLQVVESGAAVVHGAVTDAGLCALVAELAELPYAAVPPDAQPATSDCDLCVVSGSLDALPALRVLRAALVSRVQQAGGVVDWQPNEVFVRRYASVSTGMPPHRDGVRFRHLVMTLTATGRARFSVYRDRGVRAQVCDLSPGDLLLLRGASPDGCGPERPRHAVTGPTLGPRWSVAFRQNSEGPGSPATWRHPARVRL